MCFGLKSRAQGLGCRFQGLSFCFQGSGFKFRFQGFQGLSLGPRLTWQHDWDPRASLPR